jgi:hypothetical protein
MVVNTLVPVQVLRIVLFLGSFELPECWKVAQASSAAKFMLFALLPSKTNFSVVISLTENEETDIQVW